MEIDSLLVKNKLKILKRFLQRFLEKENYSINVACKKAILNKDKAKKRLSFAKKN